MTESTEDTTSSDDTFDSTGGRRARRTRARRSRSAAPATSSRPMTLARPTTAGRDRPAGSTRRAAQQRPSISSRRARSRRTTSRACSTSPTSTATSTWTSRATAALVSIVGRATCGDLVGRDGEVLEALQELTRLAVHRETGDRSRLMLDIGGYRAGRRAELTELGRTTAEAVKATGEPVRLEPMTPFERKVVHDAVAAAGLRSESEGEEPNRRVVVLPA